MYLGVVGASKIYSMPVDNFYIPPAPKDFSQTDFYLITVGVGAEIYTTFGHTLVRFVDRERGTDVVYNWGVFDFNDPMFVPNFVYGRMIYRMDVFTMANVLNIYRLEKRSVIHEKINLTNKQKESFFNKIVWNSERENLFYRYQYFLDNCSTRVRDYIDEILSNNVLDAYKNVPSDTNLRNAIRDHLSGFPFIRSSLEVLMNGDIDERMTAWQEMFLPLSLEKYLAELPQFDDSGRALPGTQLLSDRRVIYDYPPPSKANYTGFQVVFWLLLVPIVFVYLSLGFSYRPEVGYRFLGGLSLFWGMLSGFFGVAMLLIWFFSKHEHGYHSANLWLYWPTDFVLVKAGWHYLKGRAIARRYRWQNLLYWSSALHLAATGLFLCLFLSGIISQDVSRVLVYQGSIAVMIYGIIVSRGFARGTGYE